MTIEAGQRLVHDPQVEGGRMILDTWTPGSVAGCSRQPHVLNFVVDPFTGTPGRGGPTFDANGDGYFDSADSSKAAIVSFSNSGPRANISIAGGAKISLARAVPSGSMAGDRCATLLIDNARRRQIAGVKPGDTAGADQISRSNCRNSSTSSKLRYTEAKRT